MPPTLIVEDGSGVSNANCYVAVAGARSYAADRGVTLDASDDVVGAQIIMATDYLESLDYIGVATSITQSLSWPRQRIMINDDTPFPSNQIPTNLIKAQCQLVVEQANGIVLQPTSNVKDSGASGFIIEERVDIIDTKYSDKIGTTSAPVMPKVLALLRDLLVPIPVLRSVRV